MARGLSELLVQFRPPGGRGDPLVVPCPSDLRFDREAPGGHKTMSCSLVFPPGTATPVALTDLAEVFVVDRRTAKIVWYGELTDPGISVSQGWRHYSVTAQGAQIRTDGWREVYGLVDRAQESWQAVGDFQGSSASFSGDFTPDGLDFDIDLGDINFDDLLSPDFGDGFSFGGDLFDGLVDLGNGSNFPTPGKYPGYLGFISNPGPINIGLTADGSFWDGWEPGEIGGTATGTTTGILTPSGTARVSRHRVGTSGGPTGLGGLMMTLGYLGASSSFWTSGDPSPNPNVIASVSADFVLSSGSTAQGWLWADATLSTSGFAFQATESGAVTISIVDGGSWTGLGSDSWTPSVGVTYTITFSVVIDNTLLGATQLSSPYDVEYSNPTLSLVITQSTTPVISVNYYYATGYYRVFNPDLAQPKSWVFTDGTYWGLGATGGQVEYSNITYYNAATPE